MLRHSNYNIRMISIVNLFGTHCRIKKEFGKLKPTSGLGAFLHLMYILVRLGKGVFQARREVVRSFEY